MRFLITILFIWNVMKGFHSTNLRHSQGENGDTLVGKWKATVSGTEIDCRKSSINDNRYICSFNGYRAIVTWKSNVFTWHGGRRHYGRATGFITFESGVRAPRMIWSSGAVWRKQTKGNQCKTVAGPSPNEKCVFPFKFNGNTYKSCAFGKYGFWCSTRVNSNGNHIGGRGFWGICGPNCPTNQATSTATTTTTTPAPTVAPNCDGIPTTDWSCCSPSNQCSVNEGDCDTDSDCAGSLVCGSNNCQTTGLPGSSWSSGADCCIESDACNPNPCKNGGTCLKVERPKKKKVQPLYICICPEEFTGQDCEIAVTSSIPSSTQGYPSTGPSTTIGYPSTKEPCEDTSEKCAKFVPKFCTTNKRVMERCKASCRICVPPTETTPVMNTTTTTRDTTTTEATSITNTTTTMTSTKTSSETTLGFPSTETEGYPSTEPPRYPSSSTSTTATSTSTTGYPILSTTTGYPIFSTTPQ